MNDVNRSERYLGFSLGGEHYAIPLLSVKEVLAIPEITPLPFSPSHFLGIMNLRGQVISVVDLRLKLGIKSKASADNAIIICDLGGICLGVVVDSIDSVLSPEPDKISQELETNGGKSGEFISGVYRKDDQLVVFLNVAKVLNLEDRQSIQNASRSKAA